MIIGLTGAYCAGKNHIASLLKARGLPVLDVDKLGYTALETEKEAVFAHFGRDLQTADGVNRQLLGQRVFGKPDELAALEEIVHPVANRLTDEWIAEQKGKACVINAALLHRSAAFGRLDRIILVTAPFFTRFLRARRRDRLSFSDLFRRFASQKNFNSQYLTANAEIYRVENPGLSGAGCISKKLERRINDILEGIY